MKKIDSRVRVLSDKELLLIHDSALKILEDIGVYVPCADMLQNVAKAGAKVDFEKEIMRIPRKVMEDFVINKRAVSDFTVSSTPHNLCGIISTQIYLIDSTTGERRYGLLDDVMKGIKLTSALNNIPVANAVVVPSDVPYEISDVISCANIYKYSEKPGGTYILTPTGLEYIMMLDKLMSRTTGYLFENISPLSYKKDTCEMAMTVAKNGGMLGIAPMAMSSATAPVTVAGTLTLETAEILGSMFIVESLIPGYQGFAASCHSADPKTMLCSFGSPNQALFAVAASQLAEFYGIQGGANTALTDSIMPDFQSGFEKGVTATFTNLSGLGGIGCQGIAGADQGFSFEQLVIDNEWIDYYNYITNGFEVNEATIGYETIKEVGVRGNFLDCDHTVEYLRESYWNSRIFSTDDFSVWSIGGKKQIVDKAREFVEANIQDYKNMTPVLTQSVCDEIDYIVSEAKKVLKNKHTRSTNNK